MSTRRTSENIEMYQKEIQYDCETHDYAMYLNGELVGFARNYHEAEITLDQLIFELMQVQQRSANGNHSTYSRRHPSSGGVHTRSIVQ